MTPEQLAIILQELEPELPELVGQPAWTAIAPTWTEKLQQLQVSDDEIEQMRLAAELRALLAPYTPARERLRRATGGISQYQQVLTELAGLATQLNSDPHLGHQLRKAAALHSHLAQTRLIILQGVGQKAQSFKWQNIEFDFGDATEMAETAAGILAAFSDIISPSSNHLLMAAGVLLVIRGLLKASTEEISEQDASVFWGLIQAQRHHPARHVNTAKILEHTNQERAKVHLPDLNEQQVRHALHNLETLSSVAQPNKAQDIWRVIEKYRTVPSAPPHSSSH
jgi:hypothetical protein